MSTPGETPRERAQGDVLDGRYRLVERLGRGGFGDVWRAEELLPGGASFREVALKLLAGGVTDAAYWAEEAKLLASFRHPSLVTIYAAGLLHDAPGETAAAAAQPYVAMELLIGDTLADRLKHRGRLPWRAVLRWARDVAAALDVIHRHAVVHLDLKPANLFLTAEGALKVLDFGIAKRAGAPASRRAPPMAPGGDLASLETAAFMAADHTAFAATRPADATERAVIGTPGFMAPEVLEHGEPTAATDAYALAVCIVQLTTGHFPQAVEDEPSLWTDPSAVSAWWHELRAATLKGELRDLAADPAGLPRGVVALLERLLAVDPERRRVVPGGLFALLDEAWVRPHGVPDPPYLGLEPFGPEHEGMLFGRDDDIARLGRELEYEPCVVLQGARGVGKSSLARAGLVPYLARRGADDKDDWTLVRVDPRERDDALDDALAALDPSLRGKGLDELAAACEVAPAGVVLLIDPLEAATADQAPRLAALLEALCAAPRKKGLRAVASVREESTTALLATPLGAAVRASLRYVGGPTAAAVDDLVAAPARLAGAVVRGAGAVSADIQRELRADGGHLPFVALALAAWWETREPGEGGAVLSGGRWKELGGLTGALGRHADRVVEAMPRGERALAGELCARLSSTDGSPVRWARAELIAAAGVARGSERWAEAEAVLDALARAHVVRARGDEIEIAHEALLESWSFLVSARLSAMDRIAFRERLKEAALAWDRAGGHRDLLWRGAVLAELGAHRDGALGGLAPVEEEFVRASRRAARRGGWIRLALLALGCLVIAGGVLLRSLSERREAEAMREKEEALARAYLSDVLSKSRRTEDPYQCAAWIVEAMEKRSADGMLPLDLASAVGNVPQAKFLTLDQISGPTFPWDDRWLIGQGWGGAMVVVDLRPSDPDVIEHVDLDFDPEKDKLEGFREPRVLTVRPHADPLVEKVPFAFDSSIVTRSVSGDVRVWRMRETGTVALAAIAPMRCTGAVRTAEAAPVVACATDEGIARWDLRYPKEFSVDKTRFLGNVLDVSPDGARVAAANRHKVLLWSPDTSQAVEYTARGYVALARWSPRDRVIALIEGGTTEVVDLDRPSAPIFEVPTELAPVAARWDEGGVDLAVCAAAGDGRWYYLRRGGRAASDPPPPASKSPCAAAPSKRAPVPLREIPDFGPLGDRYLGPHALAGGWRLSDGRWLTRDLVLVPSAEPAAQSLLRFQGRTGSGAVEDVGPGASIATVVRAGDEQVAFQIGGEIRVYRTADGKRVSSQKGNLLHRCDDGRLFSWARQGDDTWRVLDGASDASIGVVAREPGIVVGGDAACSTLFWQRLDGTLMATPLAPGAGGPRPIAVADGYVYDVRRSAAGPGVAPGLVVALSSGALARIDDGGDVRVLGYATPRATAIADGAEAGEVAYADASGVVLLRRRGEVERVLAAPGAAWEDLSMAPDGATMLLAAPDRLSVLDLQRHEILGSAPFEGLGRLTRWDPEGSVLAWSFDRVGGAEGQVIPRGLGLVRAVARQVSNLEVRSGKLALRK